MKRATGEAGSSDPASSSWAGPGRGVGERLAALLGAGEVEADPRLQMLLAALLFYFHVTFANFRSVGSLSAEATAAFNYLPTWPFENLRWLIFLDAAWTDRYLGALSLLALAGVILTVAGRFTAALGVLAFCLPNELYYYLSELRIVHNYYHLHLFLTTAFLLARRKLFFFRLTLLACYLDAGFAKLTPSWLAGEAFNSVPDKLPLLPQSEWFVTLASRGLILLELFGGLLWFSRNRALRLAGVAAFAAFHAYSVVIVGYLYPALMLSTLLPAFLVFDAPLHEGYQASSSDRRSWAFLALMLLGGLWPSFIPGSSLLTGEGRYFGLFMFEANRGAVFEADIAKGDKRLSFRVERVPRTWRVADAAAEARWGTVSGWIEEGGQRRELDAGRVLDDDGVVIWNPQLFTAGDTVVFGDPYLYYFYGKELCRRYRPDRLSIRLRTTLNRKPKSHPVLDIDDFCRLNPSYSGFWSNPWIQRAAL